MYAVIFVVPGIILKNNKEAFKTDRKVMDERLKEVLARHRRVLLRYINPTDQLLATLVEDKVLPASMVDDVTKATCRKDKNERLLNALKLRGNAAYRKFREAMMKSGHIFLADLLYEEDRTHAALVEESDFSSLPAAPQINLSPDEVKRLAAALDAKVKYRVLKTDWKQDSGHRLDCLNNHAVVYKSIASNCSANSSNTEVTKLQEEVRHKTALLRAMSKEVNSLHSEIGAFLRRHKLTHVTTCVTHTEGEPAAATGERGRFKQFEVVMSALVQRLCGLLGEARPESESECTLSEMEEKIKQTQDLIRDLEGQLDRVTRDRDEAMELLTPGGRGTDGSTLQGVQRHINTEQIQRASLLKAVDRLSRKLRGMSGQNETSALKALQQSAVTGQPDASLVDYRFLMNHLALVEADAAHIAKRLSWRDVEVKALRAEVTALRRRFMCRKESPDFQADEVELGD